MKPIGLIAVVTVVLFIAGFACSGGGSGPTDSGNNGDGNRPAFVTFSGSVQPIFTARCALSECHAGSAPVQDMSLEPGKAFADIVNVESNVATLKRIRPFLPDSSYLVHKIQGTQTTVGGSGARMPLRNCCLSQDEIDVIRTWVKAGAPNN
ncbi:MAG: hypothetical protein ACE5HT_13455 [Gemmatimonadales bacterium]